MSIQIKNTSTSQVIVVEPNYHFRRPLMPNQSAPVPDEVFESLQFDPGFQILLENGYIKVIDDGASNVEVIDNSIELSEIETIIKTKDITKFVKLISTASAAAKEAIVQYAIQYNATEPAFTSLIKKYCNVDVLEAINMQRTDSTES